MYVVYKSLFESVELGFLLHNSITLSSIFEIFISIFFFILIFFKNNNFFIYFISKIHNFFFSMSFFYLGSKKSSLFFPILLYVFYCVILINIGGLIPVTFTATTHFTYTLSYSILIWFTIITLGFFIYSISFLNIIIPKNVPYILVPFLILIELFSYIFRFISLGLRLFTNILAGHLLIHLLTLVCFSSFFLDVPTNILFFNFFFFLLLLLLFFVLFIFEFIIGFLQGYIFVLLLFIYLLDI